MPSFVSYRHSRRHPFFYCSRGHYPARL